jgi:hypothetical protein
MLDKQSMELFRQFKTQEVYLAASVKAFNARGKKKKANTSLEGGGNEAELDDKTPT